MECPAATPRLTAEHDSDVTLAASYGESDSDSDYVELCENSPTSSASTPELERYIHELQQMHEVAAVKLKEFTQLTELFTQSEEVELTNLSKDKTTPSENHRDNVATLPHGTQPSSPHSPLTDGSVYLELPLLCPCIDTVYLTSTANHPKVRLKAAEDALFSV